MRLAVLSTPASWYFQDLQRAAARMRLELDCLSMQTLRATLDSVTCVAADGKQLELAEWDAVLVRSMPVGSLEQIIFRMDALRVLEQCGTRVFNPAQSLELAIDKYLTSSMLHRNGFLTVPTTVCQSWQDAMQCFRAYDGDVVVKPIFGSEGRGIMRIQDESLAWRTFRALHQIGQVLYIQPFIEHLGYDMRILCIGSQRYGIRRIHADDWRLNVSRGARAEVFELDKQMTSLADRLAELSNCPLLAIDLLPARDGRVFVLELNAVPGWRAVAACHGIDIARRVLQFVMA